MVAATDTRRGATVIKLIVPQNALNPDGLRRAILNTMRDTAEAARVDFVATTNTWDHKPTFERKELDGGTTQQVYTTDEVWGMLERGTRPHIIMVKRAKFLKFAWDGYGSYGAKTKPGLLSSKNARYPTEMNYRKSVNHPGTKAREWRAAAIRKYSKLMQGIMNRAIAYQIRRQG